MRKCVPGLRVFLSLLRRAPHHPPIQTTPGFRLTRPPLPLLPPSAPRFYPSPSPPSTQFDPLPSPTQVAEAVALQKDLELAATRAAMESEIERRKARAEELERSRIANEAALAIAKQVCAAKDSPRPCVPPSLLSVQSSEVEKECRGERGGNSAWGFCLSRPCSVHHPPTYPPPPLQIPTP
jgi:hypothetical protein